MGVFEPCCLSDKINKNPANAGLLSYSGGGIRTRDLRVMSPNLSPAGLRGARFQAAFARMNYVEIGWNLWGFLPHFLPQRSDPEGDVHHRWLVGPHAGDTIQ